MKKILNLMTGSLVLICSVSIAQPILTATGINPVLGDEFTYYTTNYVSPGSSGANQTWDLSSLTGTNGGLVTIVPPSSTTNGSSFASSTVAAESTTSGNSSYYKTTTTALQISGIDAGGTVITYSNFEDFLHFPFSFNNTYTDIWSAQYFTGYQFWRTGSTTVTADSYGTLITPNGTYTNVMRVHFVQVYQDSAYTGSPYIITSNKDQYFWYKEGNHLPIASVYTLNTSSGGSITGGYYNFNVVGIVEAQSLINSSNVYPNPAVDKVTLDFRLTESKKVDVMLVNSFGQKMEMNQTIYGDQGINTIQLNVATLTAGIYFVQLYLDGNLAVTKRFVVNK